MTYIGRDGYVLSILICTYDRRQVTDDFRNDFSGRPSPQIELRRRTPLTTSLSLSGQGGNSAYRSDFESNSTTDFPSTQVAGNRTEADPRRGKRWNPSGPTGTHQFQPRPGRTSVSLPPVHTNSIIAPPTTVTTAESSVDGRTSNARREGSDPSVLMNGNKGRGTDATTVVLESGRAVPSSSPYNRGPLGAGKKNRFPSDPQTSGDRSGYLSSLRRLWSPSPSGSLCVCRTPF